MDWIKGKPGGRGSQEDRKTERQSVSIFFARRSLRRHADIRKERCGTGAGRWTDENPLSAGAIFGNGCWFRRGAGCFVGSAISDKTAGPEKRSNTEDGGALSENFNLNKYDKSRKGAFQSGSYRKRKRYFSARNLYHHRRKRRRKPIGTNA